MRDLLLGGLTRIARLSVAAIVGLALLIFAVAPPIGAVYVWLTTGLSPLAQVREGGTLAAFVMWPIVGLAFTPIHVLGASVEGGGEARVAVAAVTGCLAAPWVLALHRGRAYEHTLLQAIIRRWQCGQVESAD